MGGGELRPSNDTAERLRCVWRSPAVPRGSGVGGSQPPAHGTGAESGRVGAEPLAPCPSPWAAKREGGTLAYLISAPTPSVQQHGDAPAGAAIPRTRRMREASSIVPAPLGRGPGLSARPAAYGFSRVESRPARCRLRPPHHRRLPASPSKRQQRVGDHAVVFSLSWS